MTTSSKQSCRRMPRTYSSGSAMWSSFASCRDASSHSDQRRQRPRSQAFRITTLTKALLGVCIVASLCRSADATFEGERARITGFDQAEVNEAGNSIKYQRNIRTLAVVLLRAGSTGDLKELRQLAAAGIDVNLRNAQQTLNTALHFAAIENRIQAAEVLLDELGASVNLRNEYGRTPLHLAAQQGHTLLCTALLQRGADASIVNDEGQTAAQEAVAFGHLAAAEALGWDATEQKEDRMAAPIDQELMEDTRRDAGNIVSEAGTLLREEEEKMSYNSLPALRGARSDQDPAEMEGEGVETSLRHRSAAGAESQGREQFGLRAHSNPSFHPLIVCASPNQRESIPQPGVSFNCLGDINISWAGGNQQNCPHVRYDPECTRNTEPCNLGEVSVPAGNCHFPFEHEGKLQYQCVEDEWYYYDPRDGSNRTSWCLNVPNFSKPCSAEATAAGCRNDVVTELATQRLPCNCNIRGTWNGPTAGGIAITIVGIGFGSNPRPCAPEYMTCLKQGSVDPADCIEAAYPGQGFTENFDAFPANCNFLEAAIGATWTSNVRWTSDSTVSLRLSPGYGNSLPVNLRVGRYQRDVQEQLGQRPMYEIFSYDRPAEAQVLGSNDATQGKRTITVVGKNFHGGETSIRLKVGDSRCDRTTWMSQSSVQCVLGRGTGGGLTVQLAVNCSGTDQGDCEEPENGGVAGWGLTRVFSYDKPSVSSVQPRNAPPVGLAAMTIYGNNFGYTRASWRTQIIGGARILSDGIRSQSLSLFPGSNYYRDLHALQSSRRVDGVRVLDFVCVGGINDGFFCLCNSNADRPLESCQSSICGDEGVCRAERYICMGDQPPTYRQCSGIAGSSACEGAELGRNGVCTPIPLGKGCQFWEERCNDETQCVPTFLSSTCEYTVAPDGITCQQIEGNTTLHALMPEQHTLCNAVVKGQVSGTECITLTWQSDSSVICRLAPGIGTLQFVNVQIDDQSRSLSYVFSYDTPVLSSLPLLSQPASGGVTVTFSGANFGVMSCNRTWCSRTPVQGEQISHRARNGDTACITSIWVSDSSLWCKMAPGSGTNHKVEVSILASTSELSLEHLEEMEHAGREAGVIGYSPPAARNCTPGNAAALGDANMTIVGINFGQFDTSTAARVMGTPCKTTAWVSDTILLCIASHGLTAPPCRGFPSDAECRASQCRDSNAIMDPSCRMLAVTVDRQRGWIDGIFSYDLPAVQDLTPQNSPATGGGNVTVFGENFGIFAHYRHRTVVGQNDCVRTQWRSDSSVVCEMPALVGTRNPVVVDTLFNEELGIFQIRSGSVGEDPPNVVYDKPTIDTFLPRTIPTSAGGTVTVLGENYGTEVCGGDCKLFSPLSFTIGDTACFNTVWISDSSIHCGMANAPDSGPGVGQNLPAVVNIGDQGNDVRIFFCYGAPVVQGFVEGKLPEVGAVPYSANGPAAGDRELTVFGSNFGVHDYSLRTTIGESECRQSYWHSDTSIYCSTVRCTLFLGGANLDMPLQVQVGQDSFPFATQTGLKTEAYSCDPQIITPFTLTNTEINALSFIGALLLAGVILTIMHRRYTKAWAYVPPALPLARFRYPQGQTVKKKNRRPINPEKEHKMNSAPGGAGVESDSVSTDDGERGDEDFYEYDAGVDPRKRPTVLQSAFERGMNAVSAIRMADYEQAVMSGEAGGREHYGYATALQDQELEAAIEEDEKRERAPLLHNNRYYLPYRGRSGAAGRTLAQTWTPESAMTTGVPESVTTPFTRKKKRGMDTSIAVPDLPEVDPELVDVTVEDEPDSGAGVGDLGKRQPPPSDLPAAASTAPASSMSTGSEDSDWAPPDGVQNLLGIPMRSVHPNAELVAMVSPSKVSPVKPAMPVSMDTDDSRNLSGGGASSGSDSVVKPAVPVTVDPSDKKLAASADHSVRLGVPLDDEKPGPGPTEPAQQSYFLPAASFDSLSVPSFPNLQDDATAVPGLQGLQDDYVEVAAPLADSHPQALAQQLETLSLAAAGPAIASLQEPPAQTRAHAPGHEPRIRFADDV